MRSIIVLGLICVLSGCASGQLYMYNADGQKIGECTAGYNWHPIGVKASVNWLLNYCVELAKREGAKIHRVSDSSVLNKDYTYPAHSSGESWTKKLAWEAYWSDILSEEQYGYVVADLENEYFLTLQTLESQLNSGEITQQQYNDLIAKAEYAFLGE